MIMKRLFTLLIALTAMSVTLEAQEAPKKYGIKSGNVKTETEMMGQKMISMSWFDDYGALEASKTEMNGMEITTLFRDGKTYAIIPSMKRMQEMPTQESINYLNLTDEVVEKNKIKEVGKETILGKECTTYSLEVSQMGQTAKMTVCVWEGYPMKAITDAMGSVITVKVLEFTEGPVDPSLFELPNY